jgi:hypothetical protein
MGQRCVGFKTPGSAELLRKLPRSPEFGVLARVDPWAASQKDNPSRPEAIGRLAELGLAITQRGCTKKATKAAEMASQAIDRLGDLSATDEEWQLRKRRSPEGAPARWGDADTGTNFY